MIYTEVVVSKMVVLEMVVFINGGGDGHVNVSLSYKECSNKGGPSRGKNIKRRWRVSRVSNT